MNKDEMTVSRIKLKALEESIAYYKKHAEYMNKNYVWQAEYYREQNLCENEVLGAHYLEWKQIFEGLMKMVGDLMHEEG